jgi:hypothetical protein
MVFRICVFSLGLMLLSHCLRAQKNASWGLDIQTGAAVPLDKKTNEVFHLGLNMLVNGYIPALEWDKLKLRPGGGMKWYFKTIEKENSVTEHLRSWKAGLQLEYATSVFKKFDFNPLVRLDYNWTSYYFSETYNYDPWSNTSSTATSAKYLKGHSLSADFGVKVSFSSFFLQLSYEYYNPTLTVNPDLVAQALNEGIIIPDKQKFHFNSINLNAGLPIRF